METLVMRTRGARAAARRAGSGQAAAQVFPSLSAGALALALWMGLALGAMPGARAAEGTSGAALGAPVADAAFSHPAPQDVWGDDVLRALLREERQQRRANLFCFVQEEFPALEGIRGPEKFIWTIWITGGRIAGTVPMPPDEVPEDPDELGRIRARRWDVDLKTDVRATEEEVGTSTFLVTRAWVDRIVGQCERIGQKVEIAPFAGRPRARHATGQ